jgi:hypothetical protein
LAVPCNVALTALAATGAPASAAAQHARTHAVTPRLLPSVALPSGLARRIDRFLPHATTPLSLDSTELFADPQGVTVNGVTYEMFLSRFTSPPAFDQPPKLTVHVDRTASTGVMFTGEQDHTYSYAPLTGLTLTKTAGLTRAHLRTGTSIDPSAMDVRFHATAPVMQTPCSLVTGGRGTFQVAPRPRPSPSSSASAASSPYGDLTSATL